MTYKFDSTVQLQNSRYGGGLIAHSKYTLTNDTDRDTVLCLIVRKHVPEGQSAADTHAKAHFEGEEIEDVLLDFAEDYGWLDEATLPSD